MNSPLIRSPAWSRPAALVLSAALVVLIAAHLGLIGIGYWNADEYLNFYIIRGEGFAYVTHRILHWSPRPISESVIYLYALLVDRVHSPLIWQALLPWWVGLLSVTFWSLPRTPREGWPWRLLTSTCLMSLFLLGHPVSEMFYWPMSTMAYVVSLSGLVVAYVSFADGTQRRPAGAFASLIGMSVAALTSEVGAMFVLCFAGMQACRLLAGHGRRVLTVAMWVVPALCGVWVIILVLTGRVSDPKYQGVDSSLFHHILPSLLTAAPEFVSELLSPTGSSASWADLAVGLVKRGLTFIGLGLCWRLARPDGSAVSPGTLMAFALSCLAAAYLSIAAAYFQFGALCCERHLTFRECLIVLSIAAIAAVPVSIPLLSRWRGVSAVSAIALLTVILARPRVPDLIHDYADYRATLLTKRATWRSGTTPGVSMTFRLMPANQIVPTAPWGAGHFALDDQPPWHMLSVMLFFGKKSIDVTPSG